MEGVIKDWLLDKGDRSLTKVALQKLSRYEIMTSKPNDGQNSSITQTTGTITLSSLRSSGVTKRTSLNLRYKNR